MADPSLGELAAHLERCTRALVRHAVVGNVSALRILDQHQRAMEQRARVAGIMLVRRGVTYGALARALGVTPQAARRRFGVDGSVSLFRDRQERTRGRTREWQTLDALRQHGPTDVQQLAQRIGVSRSTAQDYLRRLTTTGRAVRVRRGVFAAAESRRPAPTAGQEPEARHG